MGWGRTLTFLPFGKLWKMHRKFLQTSFSSTNVRQWHDLQTREARKSVASLVHDPRKPWELCLKRFAVAIVMKVSYGVDITDDSDPHVQIASDAMYATANGGAPANSIVENFPWGELFNGSDSSITFFEIMTPDEVVLTKPSTIPTTLANKGLAFALCAGVALGH